MSTILIHHVRLADESNADTWILIEDEMISSVGKGNSLPDADIMIDGHDLLALPGVIDCHVHFREPGMTQKADIASESRAAIAGGVTSYMDMPNTIPPTTTITRWEEKMAIAKEKSLANYSFFIGATNHNIDELKKVDYTRVPGVKLFMGSSTGDMLVDDGNAIAQIFREVDAIVAVHAEDQPTISSNLKALRNPEDIEDLPVELHSKIRSSEACYKSSAEAARLAHKYHHRLHICHLTTAAELSLLSPGNPSTKLITSEVSPHHLMWTAEDYKRKGARIKMNPAVKDETDRHALRQAVIDGLIDIVATDHAPHQLSDKQGGALKATSGAPLVQFSLSWMLDNFPETIVQRVMCENPAKVYRIDRRGSLIPGNFADIILVETTEPYMVEDKDVISKCGWTPMAGEHLRHRVMQTWINGQLIYDQGKFTETNVALPLQFLK